MTATPQVLLVDGSATPRLCLNSGEYQILVDLHNAGKTLTLQASYDLVTWVDTDITFTAIGIKKMSLAEGFTYRLNNRRPNEGESLALSRMTDSALGPQDQVNTSVIRAEVGRFLAANPPVVAERSIQADHIAVGVVLANPAQVLADLYRLENLIGELREEIVGLKAELAALHDIAQSGDYLDLHNTPKPYELPLITTAHLAEDVISLLASFAVGNVKLTLADGKLEVTNGA